MLATHLSYCEDGIVSQKLLDFYCVRARHKPGLIIVGGCYVEHLGMSTPTMIGISKDEHIPGLAKLASSIHSSGVPAAAQLYHAGRYAHSLVLGESAVSASAVPSRLTKETPRELSTDEIRTTVENFGAASARAKTAGFDAVEILGSAGYLINQFLAAATNLRKDEYGGELKSRARFAIEVVKAVRHRVGARFPIVYRMGGDDFIPGGNTLVENRQLAPMLVKAGVDCFNVTGGWHETRIPQITMDVPRGHYSYLAEGIAEVVHVPVIACNRINSAGVAEHILSRGKVSLIGMSRAFIADPELPEKIRSGRVQEIRPCIACNQGCLDRVFMIEPVTCALNPEAGMESERTLGSSGKGSIAVVGAGPAGMEVSRVLALRGFDVTLFEQNSEPGGLLRLAARIPGRGEFAAYTAYMWKELHRLGVDLRLRTPATLSMLAAESYDSVVCATGTVPCSPPIDGIEQPHVMTAYDAIKLSPTNLGRTVIIGGGSVGCYAALLIAPQAESVEILERGDSIGTDLGRSTRWVIMKALKAKDIQLHPKNEVSEITSDYVLALENGHRFMYSADTVIVAAKPLPQNRLAEQLRQNGIKVDTIGSIQGTDDLLECVHSSYVFANKLALS
jgi:2,4-dienoyl-CoA reductase (NADPH2)